MAVVDTLFNIFSFVGTVFLWTWWLIIILTLYGLKKRWERYPIDAIIYEKRDNNLIRTNDRIGKHFDKDSEIHSYKLMKAKDSVPVFNYEWILATVYKPTNFLEKFINLLRPTIGTASLFRYGSKQYKPIKVGMKGDDGKIPLVEVKDKKGNPVYYHQYAQFDPRWALGRLEFDVVDWDNINFMIQEQRASAIRRQKKGDFLKTIAIPAMAFAATIILCIFFLKFSFDAGSSASGGVGQDSGGGSRVLGGIQDATGFAPAT